MTLPSSGSISMSQVIAEINAPSFGLPAGVAGANNLNSHVCRCLAGVSSGPIYLRAGLMNKTGSYSALMTFSTVGSPNSFDQSNRLAIPNFYGGRLGVIQSGTNGVPNGDIYIGFDNSVSAPLWDGQFYVKNLGTGQTSVLNKIDSFTWFLAGGRNFPYPTKDNPNPTATLAIRAV